MKPRRVIPIAITAALALMSAPVSAQEQGGGPSSNVPTTRANTTSTSAPTSTVGNKGKGDQPTKDQLQPHTVPTVPGDVEVPTLLPIPPPVDQEIAAALENQRRAVAVEEAKAAAAVEQAAADAVVASTKAAAEAAIRNAADASALLANAKQKVEVIERRLDQAGAAIDSRRDRATEIGVEMYTATGSNRDPRSALTVALLANKDVPDASTAKAYRDVVADAAFSDLQEARERATRIRKNLRRVRHEFDKAAEVFRAADQAARTAQADLAAARKQAAETKDAGEKRVAAALSAAPTLKSTELTGGLGILGDPLVSAEDLAAFVRRSGRAHPSVDVEALAATFIAEGKAEGVRSDVAWVQSIIETGWFSFAGSMVHPTDYNYAGIGACDSCSRGIIFKNMTEGVRSQVQLLRTYATRNLSTADLANPPPRLVPERSHVRGCCETWMRLSGVWATGPGYGIKILTLYNQLLAFAAARRAQ